MSPTNSVPFAGSVSRCLVTKATKCCAHFLVVSGLLVSVPTMAQAQADSAKTVVSEGGGGMAPELSRPEYQVGTKLNPKIVDPRYDISKIGSRDVSRGVNFFSLEREQALGKQLAEEVQQQSKVLRDPQLNTYINTVAQNLVRNSDAKVPFKVTIINDDEVNAFALPGGYFFVNSGLIMAAENEAELAGVMAHEIAHVAARHATRSETKGEIWNIASLPLMLAGPVGYAVSQVAGIAVPMSFLKFNRDAEREADVLGLEYSYATGYDPAAFVQFFEKLRTTEKQRPNFLAKAFASHPMTSDRIDRARKAIEQLLPARPDYVVDTSEFQEAKKRVVALVNGGRTLPDGRSRPVLHRSTADNRPTLNTSPASDTKDAGDDHRPTLHRADN